MKIEHSIAKMIDDFCKCKAMQRLKDIGMDCGMQYTNYSLFAGIPPYSRYEHSLRVAELIAFFTNDKRQVIAGLFHDISTPVFSHVNDFMQQDYLHQEASEAGTKQRIAQDAGIISLLPKYGLSLKEVGNYHDYPIADNDSPKLSCDRLEYTLTNALRFHVLSLSQAETIFSDIHVGENEQNETELLIENEESAKQLCLASIACGKVYVSDNDRFAMEYLSRLLLSALQKGILTKDDLLTKETQVISTLCASSLKDNWKTFTQFSKTKTQWEKPKENGWLQVLAKKRYIDPYVAKKGRISLLDDDVKIQLKAYLEESQSVYLKGCSQ